MAKGRPPQGGPKTGHRPEPNAIAPVQAAPIAPDLPCPPLDLEPELRDGWNAIIADLAGRGRNPASLQPTDLAMVRQILEAVWVHQQATEILHLEGVMIYKRGEIKDPETGEGTGEFVVLDAKQHPAVKTQREASATYLRLADALGLNPMARVRAGLMLVATKSLSETIGEQIARVIGADASTPAAIEAKSAPKKKPAKKPASTRKPQTAKKATPKKSSTQKKPATKKASSK